jgi:radical SAM superfamily enzyme YgiQ (UPF0313 family)
MLPLPLRKIVFIEPKSPGNHVYSKWGLPRLGTILLGTILKNAGYEVQVFCEDLRGIDFDAVFEADIVGISTITSTAPRAYEMADIIRRAGIPVFMGGPHVTFLAEEALAHCDYVFRGEAEQTILPFLEALSKGQSPEGIPGLAFMTPDGLQQNPISDFCENLDAYPFPDFSLIAGKERTKCKVSITPIVTSRGCPFGCNFCAVTRMFGRGYRFRSVANVMEEIRGHNARWLFFYDDNFAARPAHTKELLRAMIAEGITARWMAQVRIDIAKDPELLDLMKRSGCYYLYIGIESTNPKTLAALNKGQTPEEIESAIRTIQSYGINIHGMFIFGTDQDDPSTIRATVKFAKRIDLASVQFMVLTPLPGTPVFEQMQSSGRLLSRDWSYYDAHHVVYQPKNMSFLQLQKLTLRAMLRFYTLGRILSRLRRFDLLIMVVRAYGWRMTRKTRRDMRGFVSQLKELYARAGTSFSSARHGVQLRARRTTDDLRDLVRRINWDRIRQRKLDRQRTTGRMT